MPYRFLAINCHIGLLLLLLSSVTTRVFARPDMTPLGPNIADKGSAYYHFYAGLSHGQMFGASMEEALLEMSQIK